jgi:transcriptional regulator with XRE-family HTH domain
MPVPDLPLQISTVMRQLRERRLILGLSQSEIEARLNVAEGLVAKWESGFRWPSAFLLGCYADSVGLQLWAGEPVSTGPVAPYPMTDVSLPRRRRETATTSFEACSQPA